MDSQAPKNMITNSALQNGRLVEGEEDPKPKHHGGSFGNYMAYKNQKLQEQFSANAAVTKQSNLFQGVGIYVNGWTSPSHSELKHLMALHGGRFENYYSRSTVTHIVCTNLPDAKVKQFEKERSPTPVLRPEWIVHSIEAGKLLPITEYILWQLRGGPGQRTLQDAFTGAAAAVPQPPPQPQPQQPPPVQEEPSHSTHIQSPPGNNNTTINKLENYDSAELAAAQEVAAQMRADCDNLKGPPRSSKDDPNFVESFYRASRLHFIGTWKARLEALMASSAATEAPTPAPYTLGGGSGGYGKRVILHLDMDCFFASVAEAGHPEFKGKPLAVCHSNSARGSGEISSANYEARKHGIGASMFISKAKELCPGLIVVPYEFDKYEVVSEKVYRILLKYTSAVQPVSCDEAFLDITGLGDSNTIAAAIRKDIFEATQCTASAGIGPNILIARIATRKAKPNGIFNLLTMSSSGGGSSGGSSSSISAAVVLPFLAELSVEDLPGVGWSTKRKLEELGINTVADIHSRSKTVLQTELGNNAGALLWEFAHGRDARRVEGPKPRQSVGAEVNWGVRFETPEDPEKFVASLAAEVASRMQQGGVRGRTITLKLKRKKPGWVEPVKFLGMGACDSFSKSVTLASMTAAAEDLEREGKVLLRMLRVPFDEIRGMGLSVTKLDTRSGGGGVDAPAAAAAAPAAAPLAAAVEGSEASDAGWEIDTESDVRSHKQQQQQNQMDASPASSPSGRGTKRKSPGGGGKQQTSLLDMMPPPPPRTTRTLHLDRDLQDEEEEEGNARVMHPSTRREVLAKYEGLSLTQINADEMAALPYQLQMELVSRLPRTRQNTTTNTTNAGGGGGNIGQKRPPPPPPAAAAAPLAFADPAAYEASGSKPPQNPQPVEVTNYAAAIEPLPAFSQLDRSVLDALPLQLRRELEVAYGMKRTIKSIDTTSSTTFGIQHRRQYNSPPKHGAGASKMAQNDSKLQRIDAFVKVKNAPPPPPLFNSTKNSGTTRGTTSLNITLSQIDPGVLHELPRELQDEVLRQLQPFPASKKFKKVAGASGTRTAGEVKSAAAEALEQRQQLENLHAAQVEGTSLEDEDDAIENILNQVEGGYAPSPAVEALFQLALDTDNHHPISVAEVLEALSAAIEEINELHIEEESHDTTQSTTPSTTNTSQSQSQLLRNVLLPKAVMAAVSRLGKTFISHDLEGTTKLLIRIQSIGEEYPSFSSAVEEVIEKLQQRVQRRYGWRVSLKSRIL